MTVPLLFICFVDPQRATVYILQVIREWMSAYNLDNKQTLTVPEGPWPWEYTASRRCPCSIYGIPQHTQEGEDGRQRTTAELLASVRRLHQPSMYYSSEKNWSKFTKPDPCEHLQNWQCHTSIACDLWGAGWSLSCKGEQSSADVALNTSSPPCTSPLQAEALTFSIGTHVLVGVPSNQRVCCVIVHGHSLVTVQMLRSYRTQTLLSKAQHLKIPQEILTGEPCI